jgi:membrane protein DedA with SNARE-associated domain
VIRTFISLPAGVAGMSVVRFSVYTLLGCLPWTFGLTFLGYKLGERWNEVERVMRPFAWVVAFGTILAVVWWVGRRVRDLRAERRSAREPEAAEGAPRVS